MTHIPLTITEYGDGAVMVRVNAPDETDRRTLIERFRTQVLAATPPGVDDVVSGLESLLVEFDPLRTTTEQVAFTLGVLARADIASDDARAPRTLTVPFVADADTAPDLAEVAEELGLTPQDVLDRIAKSDLTVALLAAAMAPMMNGLDVPAPIRRRATPRTNVPAGAIMVAGRNLIVQPFPGPTGWRVVGRTPLRIVDIDRAMPVSFAPGDRLRFTPVDSAVAKELSGTFLEETS